MPSIEHRIRLALVKFRATVPPAEAVPVGGFPPVVLCKRDMPKTWGRR